MDTKLKKLNSKLIALILAFLVCVTSFAVVLTIGGSALINVGKHGQSPFVFLSGKSYEKIGALQQDFNNAYADLNVVWQQPSVDADTTGHIKNMVESGMDFYITDGKRICTSFEDKKTIKTANELKALGEKQGAYRLYADFKLSGNPQIMNENPYTGDAWLESHLFQNSPQEERADGSVGSNLVVYMDYSKEHVAAEVSAFIKTKDFLIKSLTVVGIAALLCLSSFIAVCILCGKKDEEGNIILMGINRWFTEIILIAVGICLFAGPVLGFSILDNMSIMPYGYCYYVSYSNMSDFSGMQLFTLGGALWIVAAIGLFLLLPLIRKIKAKRFFRDFFLVKMVQWVWSGLQDIYYGSSVMKKVILVVFAMCLCSATVVFFPVVVVLSLVFASKFVKQYEEIKKGIKEVKEGNPSYRIPILGSDEGELSHLATDINAISTGFDLAVKQELKNQRMKTELISNVSHDIKTPLTSIITYVDLLKKEGLDCEDAPKYLDVLDQKSIRLKKLTEDLFEAAKASSGDIPVHMEQVDLHSLLNQTMGELDDRFTEKGLHVILKTETEKCCVWADGQLMWRVMENLFGNAVKYALENSRVYVDIYEDPHPANGRRMAVLEIKNVSQDPLNISSEELMERFKRGDEARTTEGSGLGLSIAKDLVNIQNGKFKLIIDGDLFKVVIALDIC